MALALLTDAWAKENAERAEVCCLVVDHGLREESSSEAATVAGWLRSRNMAVEVLQCDWGTDGVPSGGQLQRQARQQRYRVLSKACIDRGLEQLLVAHHQDDQIETFLMRAMHSSGLDGLAAMQPRCTIDVTDSPGARLDVLRPLLSIEKSRLEATCVAHSQEYVDDPSNRDDRFLRVRARDLVAALGDDKPAVINLLQEVQAVIA